MPQPSYHGQIQWYKRGGGTTLVDAWEKSHPLRTDALDGDEFRYHEPSDTVIVRKDTDLTTVIEVEGAKRGVVEAVEQLRSA